MGLRHSVLFAKRVPTLTVESQQTDFLHTIPTLGLVLLHWLHGFFWSLWCNFGRILNLFLLQLLVLRGLSVYETLGAQEVVLRSAVKSKAHLAETGFAEVGLIAILLHPQLHNCQGYEFRQFKFKGGYFFIRIVRL